MKQEEQLMLSFGEVSYRRQEHGDIPLLLALDLSSGMLARRGEMRTVVRTVNLDKALRRAAHTANRLAERRTGASSLTLSAERAGHTPAYSRRHNCFARQFADETAVCRFSDKLLIYRRQPLRSPIRGAWSALRRVASPHRQTPVN